MIAVDLECVLIVMFGDKMFGMGTFRYVIKRVIYLYWRDIEIILIGILVIYLWKSNGVLF